MSDLHDSAAARTARDRLEQTRRALLRDMTQDREDLSGHDPAAAPPGAPVHDVSDDASPAEGRTRDTAPGPDDGLGGLWQDVRQTAAAWWHSHPARLALEVAEPVFDKYARAHPMRVLALSAATGAAVVLIRPWRLISVTGLLVAAVKSTQVSALASAMLRPQSSEPMRRHEAERQRQAERERWRQAQAAARARDQAA